MKKRLFSLILALLMTVSLITTTGVQAKTKTDKVKTVKQEDFNNTGYSEEQIKDNLVIERQKNRKGIVCTVKNDNNKDVTYTDLIMYIKNDDYLYHQKKTITVKANSEYTYTFEDADVFFKTGESYTVYTNFIVLNKGTCN